MRQTKMFLGMAASVVMLGAPLAQAAEYYAGKTITFVVGYAAGGPTDTTHRTYAPFLAKHIPGHPQIIIQNMTGGGGMSATNFVYEKARPDGMTILAGPWNPIGVLTGSPGLRADYTKFKFVGGTAEARIGYARTATIKKREDIVNLKTIKLAGLRPDSNQDIVARLSLEMLGLNIHYIPGYAGATQRRAAVLGGEADTTTTGIAEYRTGIEPTGVKDGDLIPLYYHPAATGDGKIILEESIKDMPDFPSFYEQVKGVPPSGPKYDLLKFVYILTGAVSQGIFAPPAAPDAAVKALRDGYAKMIKDPDLAALATERFGAPIEWTETEIGEGVFKALGNTDPKIVADLKAYLEEGEKSAK